jgi:hypothetical protein|tara:strand:- start:524 stop:856 length:333 start_codon:yes stop_codon:yes gene_type:complete
MSLIDLNAGKFDPSAKICDREFRTLFLQFCSLVCILHNKKLNLANIFLLVLKENKIKRLYKTICEFDSDYEAYKAFLGFDGSLYKSKYIKKYLNTTAKKSRRNSQPYTKV